MDQAKPVRISKKKKVSFSLVIMVFLSAFLLSSGVAAAVTGYTTVFAENNHVVLVDDVNHVSDMSIVISKSSYGGWSEVIENPLEAVVYMSDDDFVKAGVIYIYNESVITGYAVPSVTNTNGAYLDSAFIVKVVDEDGEVIYEGLLSNYGGDNGSVFLKENEKKTLTYYFKYSGDNSFEGVEDVLEFDENNYVGDQINFDIAFHAAAG